MKYANERKIYLKGIHTPDPEDVATPRWLSPLASGFYIAKQLEVAPPIPVANRAQKRAHRGPQPRLGRIVKRVSIPRAHQPWKPADNALEPA